MLRKPISLLHLRKFFLNKEIIQKEISSIFSEIIISRLCVRVCVVNLSKAIKMENLRLLNSVMVCTMDAQGRD